MDKQGKWEREVEERQRAQATALIAKLKHPKLTKKQVYEIMKQLKGMGGID